MKYGNHLLSVKNVAFLKVIVGQPLQEKPPHVGEYHTGVGKMI